METFSFEEQNKRKGKRISLVIHIIIILLAFLYLFPNDPDQNIDTQYAVAVNFANSKSSASTKSSAAAGKKRPKTEEPIKIETTPTKKVETTQPNKPAPKIKTQTQPKPTDPIVSENTVEEAEVEAVEEEIPVDEPDFEVVEDTPPEIITIQEPEVIGEEAPSLEDILSEIESAPESSEGTVDDVEESSREESGPAPSMNDESETGTGKADSGTGAGAGDSGDDNDSGLGDGGEGLGEFDDSGDGIFGRKVIYRDHSMMAAANKSGRIVFKVCINRAGNVTYVELNELETTIDQRDVIKKGMNAMWKYKYAPDPRASREQCGRFSVIIDNYQGIK
jgi:outer membrane biosynthesis protein TonB